MISIKRFEHWSGRLGAYFIKSIVENKLFINGFKSYTVAWRSREFSYNNVQKANLSYGGYEKSSSIERDL